MNPAAKWIRRLSPSVAKADLTRFVRDLLKANTVVNALFTPADADTVVPLSHPGNFTRQSIFRVAVSNERVSGEMLPLPPVKLQYYKAQGGTDRYLTTGRADAEVIRQYLDRLGVRLNGISVMDWGCRDCRVLRHFASDARVCEFWGVDQHGPSMEWAKASLSPPFRFVTCSAYPHLPFEDRTFDVIYAISVLTHIASLSDAWLMELRRILKPGGYGLFTVHDEHTWQLLIKDDVLRGNFGLKKEDIARAEKEDLVVIDGPDLPSENVNVFCSTARIRREWGQYFEIVSHDPYAYYHQSMVVLRKPV
jgi:SAM-dependent methyltransferase